MKLDSITENYELANILGQAGLPIARSIRTNLIEAVKLVSLEDLSSTLKWALKMITLTKNRSGEPSTDSVILSNLTQIRRAFYDRFPEQKELITKTLSLKRDRVIKEKKRRESVQLQKLADVRFTSVADLKAGISRLKPGLFKDDVIICMLCSGRRLVDVLRITTLPPLQSKKFQIQDDNISETARDLFFPKKKYAQSILIDKVSKQIETSQIIVRDIRIPLLYFTYSEFAKAWKRVRAYMDLRYANKTNIQLSSTISPRLGAYIKSLGIPNITGSHKLRKLYASVCADYLRPKNIDTDLYIHHILMHASLGLATVLPYKTIQIDDAEIHKYIEQQRKLHPRL